MSDPQNPQPPAYQPPPAYQAPAYDAPAYQPAPPAPGGGYVPNAPVPGKTLGIVAFVLSFFMQFVALILGIVALVQSKKAGRGNGWAVAAIIISAVLMVIGVILALLIVVPSLNAATTCLNDPSATVMVWGVNIPCQQLLEQSR